MTTVLALLVALVLDAWLGEPRWLWSRWPHPAVVMGRAVGWLDRRLNSAPARHAKGVLAVLVLSLGALALGMAIARLGWFAEALVAAMLLAQRSLVDHVRDVARALRLSVAEGRMMVRRIVSRNTADMTPDQVARAAIESAAENLSDGVVAPAFWFLLAGAPGILFYKVINTADSMIGYRTPHYAEFGWAAARLDDLLNLIPARLTALIIALLGGHLGAWRGILSDARQHRSPNAGWPEAAMARSLDVALSGPRSYDGQVQPLAWVNETARRDIGPAQIDACIAVMWRVWWVMIGATALLAIL